MNLLKQLYNLLPKIIQNKLEIKQSLNTQKPQRKIYNTLPHRIKNKFNISYSERLENGFTIFKTKNDKWAVLDQNYKLLIQPNYESIGFTSSKNWFVCTNFNGGNSNRWSYFIYDLNGQLLSQNGDFSSIQVDDFGNVICCIRNQIGNKRSIKYGLLNDDLTIQIVSKYDAIISLSTTRFKVYQNYKWGIVNEKDEIILSIKYQQIHNDFDDKYIFVENDKNTFQVNRNGVVTKLPYNYFGASNNFRYMTSKAITPRLITIIGKEDEESAAYDRMDEYIGKWGIIDFSGNIVADTKYDYIEFFKNSSDFFKIVIGEMTFDWKDGNIENDYEMNGGKYGVIGLNNHIVIPPKYDWIQEISDNLFAVNIGGQVYYNDYYQCNYWEVKGGKWGVINHQSKLIVPIEYDAIMLNWFRVKDYIFVQNGTTYFNEQLKYDIYDFDGNQIINNKPKPENHRYYA